MPDQASLKFFDVASFGQVFTPDPVVRLMLSLRRRSGRVLEPSCGDGAFLAHVPDAVGIELDPGHCPSGALNMDFFDYPVREQFDTIIGNPPYVRFQDIPERTRQRLDTTHFDARSNLYLFFIEKCLRHLRPGGELIFITPRDFLKATSALRLNRLLYGLGTITEAVELGDARVFEGALPNCLIWRFEKGLFDRQVRHVRLECGQSVESVLADPPWQPRYFVEHAGHLMFARGQYPLSMRDIAMVKVGAVSGADEIYASETRGNRDFVCSQTVSTGATRRMIWCEPGQPAPPALLAHKARLIARRIRRYDEGNWWEWGRGYHQSDRPRVYVNGKTRRSRPFFLHDCPHYDGSVLALFPLQQGVDLPAFSEALNRVDWEDLGFVCDGRHLFTQRSLQNTPLPEWFAAFLPK